jgi:hypothetical protein
MEPERLADARITIPDYVVRREFPEETIVLNLQSGQYHGLDPIAAFMLEAVADGSTTPAQAAGSLAEHFGQPPETVREDLFELVEILAERGLVDVAPPD